MDDEIRMKVPAFVLTKGRTRARVELALEALVTLSPQGRSGSSRLALERKKIAELALHPISVAEIAAHLSIPLGTARVLVGDMVDEGLLHHRQIDGARPDMRLLERVLAGIQSL
ncbi:MAG: DUF742 domain-containing protein [Acidimicrobiales bacterium]|jgi:hypothetical protein|nr:DUF742 domain-containing protein [Acidimicrobiales bacterium]